MPQLLLELFSEEIPARMQTQAAKDLARMAEERLKPAGLPFESLQTYAGPRRLTLVIEGLPAAQADRNEEIKGPRANAPDQALQGFLRKIGLTRADLAERDGVLFASINQKGRPTPEIVAEMVEAILRAFPWPKSMRWGSGTFRWVRPLKRILCLFDGQVVPFEIEGIRSGDLTEGHRFMGASHRPIKVTHFDQYRSALFDHFVILDQMERKRLILDGARAVCAAKNLELVEDEGLLDEVCGLAEWPVPVLGDMDPAFLDLPPEVIRTSMRTHQKYFAVRPLSPPGGETLSAHPREGRDPDGRGSTDRLGGADDLAGSPPSRGRADFGKLAPNFVVVANIEAEDGGATLAAGNAKVLSARLSDARFFWTEDRKTPLEDRLDKLKGVTFHAKLGTMFERMERIEALAREIAPLIKDKNGVGADPDLAAKAARLAKADLGTGMVGEFPELQGIMGGYYARAEGLEPEVADAIRDHYKPVGPSDTVPTAPVTVAVALADKLDTLVGFFAIDEKPTGSRDPFALRRAALGVIRCSLINNIKLPLERIIDTVADEIRSRMILDQVQVTYDIAQPAIEDGYDIQGDIDAAAEAKAFVIQRWFDEKKPRLVQDLLAFFADRLKVLLRDEGKRHDLVDAVFALGDDDLVRITRRVEALSGFLATEDGANLLAGYKRAVNILKAEEKKASLSLEGGGIEGGGAARDGLGMGSGGASASASTTDGASTPNPGPSPLEGEGSLHLNPELSSDAPPEEAALAAALRVETGRVDEALAAEDFTAAMRHLAHLRAPVDAFFDKVLVNDPDPQVRLNRLRLLTQVRDTANRVADFSLISG
jgi:glycyl-tRNA synthetase beta chain